LKDASTLKMQGLKKGTKNSHLFSHLTHQKHICLLSAVFRLPSSKTDLSQLSPQAKINFEFDKH